MSAVSEELGWLGRFSNSTISTSWCAPIGTAAVGRAIELGQVKCMGRMDGMDEEYLNVNDEMVDAEEITNELWEDDDSALGSDKSSVTTSLASSVMDFRHENGRRYHAFRDGTYLVPNDEDELSRLDLQHNQWRLTLDGQLYIAPIPEPTPHGYEVLDIGTGTGTWAIEFAEEHPNSEVTGVDLSPVQPAFVPPNCQFVVDDIEYEWAYEKTFDFIHGRFLSMGIRDWPRIFSQSYAYLKPGGWVEYQEAELSFILDVSSPKPNPEMASLSDDVREAALRIEVDVRQAHSWKGGIEKAGFINHKMVQMRWPLGPWSQNPKEKSLGQMNMRNMLNGIEGLSLAYLVRIRGDPPEDVRKRLDRVKGEMRDKDVHIYMNLFVHIAQKPQ